MGWALTVLLMQAAVADPATPSATPRWLVDGSGVQCTLTRSFPDQHIALQLRRYPGGPADLVLVGDVITALRREPKLLTITFGNEATSLKGGSDFFSIRNGGRLAALVVQPIREPVVASIGASDRMVVMADGKPVASVGLPAPKAAIAALEGCSTAKLVDFGADPAQFSPGGAAPQPVGDPSAWLVFTELPRSYERPGSYQAVVRLHVAPDGRVSACDSVIALPDAGFGTAACAILPRHARYVPAHDPQAHAVTGVVTYKLDFSLEISLAVEPG